MKMKNFLELFAKARKMMDNFGNFLRNCSEILGKTNSGMNDQELGIFTTIAFYMFTILLGVSILAFPIMILVGYPTFMALAILMGISLAFPATLVKVGVKYSDLFISKMIALFEKYSPPLIGLKKSSKKIYKIQIKIQFVNTFGISVLLYILAKIMMIGKWNILSTEFIVILLCSSWATAMPMVANGIFVYSTCLAELIERLLEDKKILERFKSLKASYIQNIFRKQLRKVKSLFVMGIGKVKRFFLPMFSLLNKYVLLVIGLKEKLANFIHLKASQIKIGDKNYLHKTRKFYVISLGNAKRLKKMDIETTMMFFRNSFSVKQMHKPKRLAVTMTPKSEKIFSLRMLAIDLRAKCLNARRTAFYINGGGNS